METTRLTRKGQVVIPKAIRDRLKVMPGTELSVTLEGGRIVLNPVRAKPQRLSAWPGFGRDVPALSDAQAFAPVDLQDAP
jgi:AbrB family looped-hinge helix DNA binding protein